MGHSQCRIRIHKRVRAVRRSQRETRPKRPDLVNVAFSEKSELAPPMFLWQVDDL